MCSIIKYMHVREVKRLCTGNAGYSKIQGMPAVMPDMTRESHLFLTGSRRRRDLELGRLVGL